MAKPCDVSASYSSDLIHHTAFFLFFYQSDEQNILLKCVQRSVGCQGFNRFLWLFFAELVVKSRFETRIFTYNKNKTTQALVKTVGVK